MVDVRRLVYRTYSRLPGAMQTLLFQSYLGYVDHVPFGPSPKAEFVTEFFDSRASFRRYVDEYHDRGIDAEIEAARRRHRERTGHGKFAALNRFTPARYYALVREVAPAVVVETGVCNGVSTLVTLRAMEQTGQGQLYSVDLPDTERLPDDAQPGWIVPPELRDRWTLTLGPSQERLPAVLADLEAVDLFLHDSLAMILDAEFEHVWPLVRTDGVLVADDIYASTAFGTIAERDDVVAGNLAPNVGYAIKRVAE